MRIESWLLAACFCLVGNTPCFCAEMQSNTLGDITTENLKQIGDSGIEAVMVKFRSLRSQDKHNAIIALKEYGSEKALEALLQIAMGEHGNEKTEWAARNYVKVLKTKSGSRKLLASKDPEIQHVGLLAIKGEPISQELLEDLKKLLQSERLNIRRATANVIKDAPAYSDPKDLSASLVESIKTIDSLPNADRMISMAGSGRIWTDAGYTYRCMAWALSDMKMSDAGVLESLTPAEPGNPQDCVLIARAWLGDVSIKHELKRIVQGSKMTALRAYALAAFSVVGTADDSEFLRKIAETDPLAVEPKGMQREYLEMQGKSTDKIYPIRMQAGELIKQIEKKRGL